MTNKKLPKVPISAENLIKFYLYLWPEDRTQVEVAKALKLAEPAIRITAKSLKEAGFLTRIFNEELAPNIALSIPVEAIVRMMCKTIGWEDEDQIVAIALEDRFNFQKIDIQKVKAYDKENLNWKIANVVYKENPCFLFREVLSYGENGKKIKKYARFLNRIGFKTLFRQDIMENVIKKEVLSKKFQNYPLPRFNVVFNQSDETDQNHD